MKIVVSGYNAVIVTILSISHDDCRRPDGAPPWRIGDEKLKKISLPTVPRRGPEAVVLCREDDFHGSGVNRIDSCLFLLKNEP